MREGEPVVGMVPWWAWLLPLARAGLLIAFVLVVGIVQGRSTGVYPTLLEWSEALHRLRWWPRSRRRDEDVTDVAPPPQREV